MELIFADLLQKLLDKIRFLLYNFSCKNNFKLQNSQEE